MINKFFIWYRDNKVAFWTMLLIVVGILFAIKISNNQILHKSKKRGEEKLPKDYFYNSGVIKSRKSAVTTNSVEPERLKIANKIIDNFISLLNNGDYTMAYQLLTDDCKNELFPSLEVFKTNYYDKIFKTYKSYNMQNWVKNTYKIELRENLIDTGGIPSKKYIRDFITIVPNGSESKININSFIGKETIRKGNYTRRCNY